MVNLPEFSVSYTNAKPANPGETANVAEGKSIFCISVLLNPHPGTGKIYFNEYETKSNLSMRLVSP